MLIVVETHFFIFFLSGYTKERSSIIVIGLSFHTAPVEVREKLAIPEANWPQAIVELCALNHIEEAAVLSTCNRMEIYVVALSQHRGVKEVTEWMSKVLYCIIFFLFCVGKLDSPRSLRFPPTKTEGRQITEMNGIMTT